MDRILSYFLLAAAVLHGASALYSSSDAVVELNAQNFDKLVHQNDLVAAVEFYAPVCDWFEGMLA